MSDDEESTQIYATVRDWRLSIGCASCREIGLVGILLLSPPDLVKEGSSDQSFGCCATIDDPIELMQVSQDVLSANVTIAAVLVTDDQICDVVLFWKDELMLRC